ncbi:MAG: acetate kinase [Bacteroidales bacterium]|nr:acetate kinase [Bacteroidales bacterium]
MKILVLNCGSSSVKYKLFDMQNNNMLAQGGVEKIGLKGSFLKLTLPNGDKAILEGEILEHNMAIEYIVGVLLSEKYGCIKSISEIDAVGHRVVHGGEKFNTSVKIDDEVIANIEECIDIAPLHNPPNLKGIYAVNEIMGDIPQVAVFDTAFHQTMPAHAYLYGIPYSLYEKYSIRRYGFHGTSHRYVSQRACEILGVDPSNHKMITCHIGNGASVAALHNGISVDTSMGFTPVEGLMMGTRSGDVDAGVITFLIEKEMVGAGGISNMLNKQGGLLGVSGVSSDMRELVAEIEKGNERAALALEMYNYRLKKYIGAYAAALGGVDTIVFTGGVGENQTQLRAEVCKGLEFMGIEIDEEINKNTRGDEAIISKNTSKVTVMIVPTDEEFMIAKDTITILNQN